MNLVAPAYDDTGEFRFTVGGDICAGIGGGSVQGCRRETGPDGGDGASIEVQWPNGLRARVIYLLYPGLPVIRKRIAFHNAGTSDLALENLDVETLALSVGDTHGQIYTDYGRRMKIGPYIGDWQDSLAILHFLSSDMGPARAPWGIACGNEAPGVTKRFTAFAGSGNRINLGLTHVEQAYGFRKWLRPGEGWTSPATFIAPYAWNADPAAVLDGPVNDFVRRHMGIRLARIERRPTFVYNTWNPFRRDIDEKLIGELAVCAAEMGVEEFIIDDGWQANATGSSDPHPIGDWLVDRRKFPRGLKPVFDHIRSLGMKPGLWFSLGAVSTTSEVAARHPEWLARDRHGAPVNLHSSLDRKRVTACLGTGWRDHFRDIVLQMVRENGLGYIKLDLAIVTSAYVHDAAVSGCHATDHPGHRDGPESCYTQYERMWELFDELHAAAPDLFIDCTFEAMGKLQLVDYSMCQHAEGNWLSNFEERSPIGGWRVRQMAWWRSPAMPATALIIGNQMLEDPEWELSMQSLAGTLPIFLGDLRRVGAEQRHHVGLWAAWLKKMERAHVCSLFRQDLPGFGEPREGAWDGFARLNTETRSGGFVAVFRQHAREGERRVFVPALDPEGTYLVTRAPEGASVATLSGRALAEEGFAVALIRPADGAIFEINRQ
ncbi:MAG: alpha-galactosidase [Opitutaceae bacterium]|nr:alpha-galactosidase [Opitutaceae bacterium]